MRMTRMVAVGATLVALIVGACGPGAGSPATTSTPGATAPAASEAAGGGGTLASTLVFGGPPECPERPFCLIGLQETYGLTFAEFRALDTAGPLTVEALANGEIDVGVMLTSDPTVAARNFVLLEDDKQLQRADNLVPIVSQTLLDESPIVADLLNSVSAPLTQEELLELNRQSTEDRENPEDIAAAWLEEKALLEDADPSAGIPAAPVVVGKTNFYEQDILSELYAQVLEANGFRVTRQEASGTREVVFPALESGQIHILPEYAASALEHVNGGAGQATADAAETTALLREALEPLGLTALEPAPATDQNGIAVTAELASEHGLTKISDLAKPAP
jgi:osmoprotectant transport system substrate-binding protein